MAPVMEFTKKAMEVESVGGDGVGGVVEAGVLVEGVSLSVDLNDLLGEDDDGEGAERLVLVRISACFK